MVLDAKPISFECLRGPCRSAIGLTVLKTGAKSSEEALIVASPGATLSRARTPPRMMSFNRSIGIMLASYTRAANNQEGRSGSLFRKETKAIDINKIDKITPAWTTSMGITRINIGIPEKQYPNICFNYIHNNPVKDGLVTTPGDWEFSSYRDFIGIRDGRLINREKIKELKLTVQ